MKNKDIVVKDSMIFPFGVLISLLINQDLVDIAIKRNKIEKFAKEHYGFFTIFEVQSYCRFPFTWAVDCLYENRVYFVFTNRKITTITNKIIAIY